VCSFFGCLFYVVRILVLLRPWRHKVYKYQPIRDQNDVYDVFSDVCFVSCVLTREPEIKANLVYVLFRVCGQPKVSYLAWRD